MSAVDKENDCADIDGIDFVDYIDEKQLNEVIQLVGRDLSEPYSIFTYRYFLARHPELCIIAVNEKGESIGCVVGKIDNEGEEVEPKQQHRPENAEAEEVVRVGYIGMLAVMDTYRRRGIGKALVQRILQRMKREKCISVTLETEVTNVQAQRLYQDFGFVREELLVRYYINWNDAYRLRLWFAL